MARSKFPGKPSKQVNRTRVNVLPSTDGENTTNLNETKLKQDDCDSGIGTLDVVNESVDSIVQQCRNTRRSNHRKRVCKGLMTKRNLLSTRRRLVASPTKINSPKINHGVNNQSRSVCRKTGKRSENELSNRKLVKTKQAHIENSNLVGKFVLPSRSVHSSRVIKPNKRFINVEAVNSVQLRTFKKKVVNNKNSAIQLDNSACKSEYVVQTDTECDRKCDKTYVQKVGETIVSRAQCSNRRVILRQARLQLHTQTPSGQEGPFSSSSSSNISHPGPVTCGVCGAVRFYRFVRQARKFNIYSCESCRKFISKMIKQQLSNKKLPKIQCLKGQGMCHVPPIVRSQHWKFRCAYKARCNACWLKMCLRSFQMPIALRNNLITLLPEYMRDADALFNTSISLFSFHTNTNIDKTAIKPTTPLSTSSNEYQEFIAKKQQLWKKTMRNTDKPISDIKRQKVDLKGPRVKHVCRSASIVLGQPLALFSECITKKSFESKSPSNESEDYILNNDDILENKENNSVIDNRNDKLNEEYENVLSIEHVELKNNSTKLSSLSSMNLSRKDRDKSNKQNSSIACLVEARGKKRHFNAGAGIYVDFWKSYEPEQICRNGFGLTASISFPILAVCFLCGSAGQNPFLYCCVCCEPYHPFCLDQIPHNIVTNDLCYDWFCPRCSICTVCGESNKIKFNCWKCDKTYHPECFNAKLPTNDRLLICPSCICCKVCGTNTTKFIGNTPLCLECYRIQQNGHFCYLCKKLYDENDFYNSKILECTKCNTWSHANCEGLTNEQYQILILRSGSIQFLCFNCESLPYWRTLVDSELRICFNNVLRLLSRNEVVRNTFKNNIFYFNASNTKFMTKTNELLDESEISTYSGDDDSEINKEKNSKTVCKKYKLREVRIAIKQCKTGIDDCLQSENRCDLKVPSYIAFGKIKNQLYSNKSLSLTTFNKHIKELLESTKSTDILNVYYSILKLIFPWYDPMQADSNDLTIGDVNKTLRKYSFQPQSNRSMLSTLYNYKILNHNKKDTRTCCLCNGIGDGQCDAEERLLYCGKDEWIHANCAWWSSEVYEDIDGALENVHDVVTRGYLTVCNYCKQKGATIFCFAKNCSKTYHFPCARSATCIFTKEKTIYCSEHNIASCTSPDFTIERSIYINIDKKEKHQIEPKKIQFILGSLSITNVGLVVPLSSDNSEAIIPSNFTCTRLYWSTTEPWKLIPYVVTTCALNLQTNVITDKSFTIDHTLSKTLVDKQLKEVALWQKEIEKVNIRSSDFYEEEPQNENAADILSPELTDAILEELPHEFLDGISMQDIFPKFMNNEELLGIDFKVTDPGNGDSNKNENYDSNKKITLFDDGKETLEPISDLKIKSDCFQNHKLSTENQHSCSVTFSCKVDNTLSTNAKQLKSLSQNKSMYLQLLQVDGAYDSSDSESTGQETEDLYVCNDEPVKCERCQCTYRTQASYKRHLETCEVISTSESDSEMCQEAEQSEILNVSTSTSTTTTSNTEISTVIEEKNNTTEPFVMASYESFSAYQTTQNQVHASTLNTHTYMSSEAATDVLPTQNSEIYFSNFQPVLEQKTVPAIYTSQPISQSNSILSQSSEICLNNQPVYINPSTCNSIVNHPISIVQSTQLPVSTAPMSINQPTTISLNPSTTPIHINQPVDFQPQQLTIQSIPITQDVTPILNIAAPNPIAINTKMLSNTNVTPVLAPNSLTIALPQAQMLKPTLITQKSNKVRGRPRSLAAKKPVRSERGRYIFPQGATGGAPVVVQQLPSTNMIPTFIEAFQQHTGQNLQYITTITPQLTPTVASQPQIVQLQPEGTLVNLVSSVQPTVILPQTRVLGDQLIVDNGSLVWAPQPVQPIIYGFETIVQNTVLQSQQFLPGTVPGVLTANSSYSSTTQVFQTSKLEPILDVTSGNIVLLNSTPVVTSQSLQVPQHVATPVPTASVVIADPKTNASWGYVETNSNSPMEIQPKTVVPATNNGNNSNSCINLPVAPFVPEPGIPTNIVTPTPKPVNTVSQPRPMNRVLPMPTNNSKLINKIVSNTIVNDKPVTLQKLDKIVSATTPSKSSSIHILDDTIMKPVLPLPTPVDKPVAKESCTKEEIASLKLVLQKQSDRGIYKISNNFNLKNNSSVQIAPLKPITKKNVGMVNHISSMENNVTDKSKTSTITFNKSNTKNDPKSSVEKQDSTMLYTVETQDGFHYSSTSVNELWSKIFEAVQAARASYNMPPLPSDSFSKLGGLQILGLKSNGLKYILEQLPEAGKCVQYKPSFHTQIFEVDLDDDGNLQNSQGAARCVPYERSHEPSDMFGWLASKHRKPPIHNFYDFEQNTRRGSITSLPMAMRFRHLKLTSKQSVGVYRSQIHKRGLFCHRDIESGEMVIEYAGEVIRSILADKREKHYTVKGMGCYMFRIDENFVIDATMKGNAARFINHSCDPNCYSKVVEILGHKHIIIFALRKIVCGEELTYDYKFPFEEDKIPCTCGSRRCRKFLN